MAKDLVEILHEAKQPIPPELSVLGGMRSYPGGSGGGRGGRY